MTSFTLVATKLWGGGREETGSEKLNSLSTATLLASGTNGIQTQAADFRACAPLRSCLWLVVWVPRSENSGVRSSDAYTCLKAAAGVKWGGTGEGRPHAWRRGGGRERCSVRESRTPAETGERRDRTSHCLV